MLPIHALSLLLILCGTVPPAAEDAFLLTLNSDGRVHVSGHQVANFPGGGKSKKKGGDKIDRRWADLCALGGNWAAVRRNGYVALNGKKNAQLAGTGKTPWIAITMTPAGWFALRRGGRVKRQGSNAKTILPTPKGHYTDLTTDGDSVFALRSDGAVYQVDAALESSVLVLTLPGADKDWIRIGINGGRLIALSDDGQLMSGTPKGVPVLEAALPLVDEQGGTLKPADRHYVAFTTRADDEDGGTQEWIALRADGALFHGALGSGAYELLADLPGKASAADAQAYEDLLSHSERLYALRNGGEVYRDGELVLEMKQKRFVRLAVSTELPDLGKLKNSKPIATTFTVKAIEGEEIVLPVLAVDQDGLAADLEFQPVKVTGAPIPTELKAGVVALTVGAGSSTVKVTVSDAHDGKATARFRIKSVPADTDPAKNHAPLFTAVKKASAAMGRPYEVPIHVSDRDVGDTPVVTFLGPDFEGAVTFDSNTLRWDAPGVEHLGKPVRFDFSVTDGSNTIKRSVKVRVVTNVEALSPGS